MVCGEVSAAVACASDSNRFSASRVSEASSAPSIAGRTSLIAAGRASRRCRARHTSPMPPSPSRSPELVAAQVARLAQPPAHPLEHPRRHHRGDRAGVGREVHQHGQQWRRACPRRAGAPATRRMAPSTPTPSRRSSILRGVLGTIIADSRMTIEPQLRWPTMAIVRVGGPGLEQGDVGRVEQHQPQAGVRLVVRRAARVAHPGEGADRRRDAARFHEQRRRRSPARRWPAGR